MSADDKRLRAMNARRAAYRVEVRGDSREIYVVEASDAVDAMDRWADGVRVLAEVDSCEPVSAELNQ